jgi:hypothetical protein
VPLVSGVCRMASAPMLSHSGSRLNASKPEANPKTRCPTTQTKIEVSRKVRLAAVFASKVKNIHNSTIESPFKILQALLVSVAPSISNDHKTLNLHFTPTLTHPKRTVRKFEKTTTTTKYVPLQTREHAWAGMSGMLHICGARGAHYVPRR